VAKVHKKLNIFDLFAPLSNAYFFFFLTKVERNFEKKSFIIEQRRDGTTDLATISSSQPPVELLYPLPSTIKPFTLVNDSAV
jgi:hypothetical protein